jgi:hypothetical protein
MLTNLLPISPLRRYLLCVEGDDGAGGGGGGGGNGGVTFTPEQQAEVDRIQGRTRAEAARAAKREAAQELAEQLGCTVEEAKAKLDKIADDDKAAMTEAERIRAEAEADKVTAAAERAKAAAERFDAKVERKLLAAGVGKGLEADAAEKALARARRALALDAEADDDTIGAEIEALKTEVPSLFAETAAPAPAGSQIVPPRPPAGQAGAKSAVDAGAERYKSQHSTAA